MDYEAGTSSSAVAAVAEVQTTGIEALMGKVGSLMNEIKANLDNPNPVLLHALSAILESQKLRYIYHLCCAICSIINTIPARFYVLVGGVFSFSFFFQFNYMLIFLNDIENRTQRT